MRKFFSLLVSTPLFVSIQEEELEQLLPCLGATLLDIPREGFALMAGDATDHFGIVLEGQLQVSREDAMGNRVLVAVLEAGELYGESLAFSGIGHSPVGVAASAPSKVLRLEARRMLGNCPKACAYHTQLITNMLGILSKKNLHMQRHIELLSRKTIRERIVYYLQYQKKEHGNSFTVPMNRNELAEYLAVDRSALSRELSKLREEGHLRFEKNRFILREPFPS